MRQDVDYRLLESSYRQSAEYAAMAERYPLLRSGLQLTFWQIRKRLNEFPTS